MRIKKSESCTEERIIEAAKTVFIRKGFDGASMEDIAAEAKITRPSLNYYFRTKEKLFSATFKDVISSFLPRVENVALGKKPVFKRIEGIVEIYTEMLFKTNARLHPFTEGISWRTGMVRRHSLILILL